MVQFLYHIIGRFAPSRTPGPLKVEINCKTALRNVFLLGVIGKSFLVCQIEAQGERSPGLDRSVRVMCFTYYLFSDGATRDSDIDTFRCKFFISKAGPVVNAFFQPVTLQRVQIYKGVYVKLEKSDEDEEENSKTGEKHKSSK